MIIKQITQDGILPNVLISGGYQSCNRYFNKIAERYSVVYRVPRHSDIPRTYIADVKRQNHQLSNEKYILGNPCRTCKFSRKFHQLQIGDFG